VSSLCLGILVLMALQC